MARSILLLFEFQSLVGSSKIDEFRIRFTTTKVRFGLIFHLPIRYPSKIGCVKSESVVTDSSVHKNLQKTVRYHFKLDMY